MAKKLKVFRTAIGFHDAYVAAPSMKAALEAWGASRNLFTSGAAEEVTDAKLAAEALAQPGAVLKVLRGTPAEQLAALGTASAKAKPAKVKARSGPKPSRDKLDDAEAALAGVTARFASNAQEIDRAEAALKAKREALDKAGERATKAAEARRDRAAAAYDRAVERWKGD